MIRGAAAGAQLYQYRAVAASSRRTVRRPGADPHAGRRAPARVGLASIICLVGNVHHIFCYCITQVAHEFFQPL
jgi:hypothetical protein